MGCARNMNTKKLRLGGEFLVDAIYRSVKAKSGQGDNVLAKRLLSQISVEDVARSFEVKSLGDTYAKMNVFPFTLRIYEIPEQSLLNHPQIKRIIQDINYLHKEGFGVMTHGHLPSKNLYYVLTSEREVLMPTETAFEPQYAEWME